MSEQDRLFLPDPNLEIKVSRLSDHYTNVSQEDLVLFVKYRKGRKYISCNQLQSTIGNQRLSEMGEKILTLGDNLSSYFFSKKLLSCAIPNIHCEAP